MEELITFEFLAIFAQCDSWYFLPRWDFLKSPFFSYHVIVRLCQSNPDNSTDEVRTVLVTLQCLPQDGCLWFTVWFWFWNTQSKHFGMSHVTCQRPLFYSKCICLRFFTLCYRIYPRPMIKTMTREIKSIVDWTLVSCFEIACSPRIHANNIQKKKRAFDRSKTSAYSSTSSAKFYYKY